MATFKVVVRKKRADGFYPMYIRVVHRWWCTMEWLVL